ncbi:MAG TPA: hypothetical protein VGC82_07240, partial [Rhodopila sp.]
MYKANISKINNLLVCSDRNISEYVQLNTGDAALCRQAAEDGDRLKKRTGSFSRSVCYWRPNADRLKEVLPNSLLG